MHNSKDTSPLCMNEEGSPQSSVNEVGQLCQTYGASIVLPNVVVALLQPYMCGNVNY